VKDRSIFGSSNLSRICQRYSGRGQEQNFDNSSSLPGCNLATIKNSPGGSLDAWLAIVELAHNPRRFTGGVVT